MPSRQNLINRILAGDLMDRDDQSSAYSQYQNGYDDVKIPDNLHIFYTYYQYEDYSGFGYVYGYDSDAGEFFYNSGSHCSCYGLEGQWGPEEYTYEQMVATLEREIETNDKESYYYREDEQQARIELLKTILGEV